MDRRNVFLLCLIVASSIVIHFQWGQLADPTQTNNWQVAGDIVKVVNTQTDNGEFAITPFVYSVKEFGNVYGWRQVLTAAPLAGYQLLNVDVGLHHFLLPLISLVTVILLAFGIGRQVATPGVGLMTAFFLGSSPILVGTSKFFPLGLQAVMLAAIYFVLLAKPSRGGRIHLLPLAVSGLFCLAFFLTVSWGLWLVILTILLVSRTLAVKWGRLLCYSLIAILSVYAIANLSKPATFDGLESSTPLRELLAMPSAGWSGYSDARTVDYSLPGNDAAILLVLIGLLEMQRRNSRAFFFSGSWILTGLVFLFLLPPASTSEMLAVFALPFSLLAAFFLDDSDQQNRILGIAAVLAAFYAVLLVREPISTTMIIRGANPGWTSDIPLFDIGHIIGLFLLVVPFAYLYLEPFLNSRRQSLGKVVMSVALVLFHISQLPLV